MDGIRLPAGARLARTTLVGELEGLLAGAGALPPRDREPAPLAPDEGIAACGPSGSDEAFLNEVDLPLRSRQARELIPLDSVTPRVRTAAVELW